MTTPRITALGDAAITVTLGAGISEDLSREVVSRARSVVAAGIAGVTDVVPSYASFALYFDPLVTSDDVVKSRLATLLATPPATAGARATAERHVIPVRYDGVDLDEVARRTGLSRDEVIQRHAAVEYRVFVLGFVPGFAYLGMLDKALSLPRRDSPRPRVPPGAVAIAERQSAVYPSGTPGGWHIIGTTDAPMFDPARARPALLRVGDSVTFEPVT